MLLSEKEVAKKIYTTAKETNGSFVFINQCFRHSFLDSNDTSDSHILDGCEFFALKRGRSDDRHRLAAGIQGNGDQRSCELNRVK